MKIANLIRKTFFYTLVASMVLSTVGVAGITNSANAATAGDVVKVGTSSALYMLDGNGKRFVFPHEMVYFSWFSDFSNVKTVSQSELASYTIGGNVTMRPGTKLIQFVTNESPFQIDDPRVYVVSPGGSIHHLETAQIASDLFGSGWESMIAPTVNTLAANYDSASPVSSSVYPSGSLVSETGSSDVYYIDGSSKRLIANDSAFNANGFDDMYVYETTSLSSFSSGSIVNAREDDLASPVGAGGTTTSAGSGLTISLSGSNPSGATLPQNSNQVELMRFNASASSDGQVTLDGVTIKRIGAGDEADFENIYLYDGAMRITTGRSINSDSQSVSFNNLDIDIAEGATKSLSVIGDVANRSGSSGDVHMFEISSASVVSAGGSTIFGSFPVRGNEFVISGVTGGSIEITKNGSVSDPKVGEQDVKIGEFKLKAGPGEDLELKSLSLFQGGSISRNDLSDIELRQSGNVVATTDSVNIDDLLVFDFGSDPIFLDKGQSRVFEIYADINGGAKQGDNIKIYLDEDSDLLAIGQSFGFGVSVNRTSYDGGVCISGSGSNECSYSAMEAGQVTITFSGPQSQDIARDSDEVTLMEFTIASQVDAEFRKFSIRLDGGSGTADLLNGILNANYTDIKVVRVSDGAVVIGPNELVVSASGTNDTDQIIVSTERFVQNAGTSDVYRITADLSSDILDGSRISASIVEFGDSDIKSLDNNQFLSSSDIIPSSEISGNTMTVLSPSLSLGLASSPVSDVYIKGSNDIALVGFNFSAGDGSPVDITSLSLTSYIDEDAVGGYTVGSDNSVDVQDIFTSVWLVDENGNQVGDREVFNSSGVAQFNSFTWTIPSGETATLVAHVDISSNAYQDGDDEALYVDIDNTSDVTARDSEGNSVNVTGASSGSGVVATVTDTGSITAVHGPVNSSVEQRLVVAGAEKVPLQNIRFSASNEELEITQIQFRVPTNTTDEVKKLYIYDGATMLGSGVTLDAGTAKAKFNFATGSGFKIPKDDNATLTVKGDLNTTSLGADSGSTISVALMYDTNFEARGTGSSDTLLNSVGISDIPSQNMYLFKTVPTVSSVALGSSTLLNGAENDLYSFKVTADNAEDVSLKAIKFSLTSTAAGTGVMDQFRLFRGGNDITDQVTVMNGAGQSLEGVTYNLGEGTTSAYITFSDEELITGGSSTTFTLKATVAGFSNGADFVSTKLADDSVAEEGHKYLGTDANGLVNLQEAIASGAETVAQSFVWSDNSASSHISTPDASSADWSNGYLVDNLPTTSLTVQVPN